MNVLDLIVFLAALYAFIALVVAIGMFFPRTYMWIAAIVLSWEFGRLLVGWLL